jgi:predicted ATPase with chaperone activity
MKPSFLSVELNWSEAPFKRMHDIPGNEFAKRALEICLSGGHEIILFATIRSPAADLLKAAAAIARENRLRFKGTVIPVCPCGGFGNPKVECTCSLKELDKYSHTVIPAMRKAAITMETVEPTQNDCRQNREQESMMTARVMRAVTAASILTKRLPLQGDCEDFLRHAAAEIHADREKAIAVAQTIAILSGRDAISLVDIAESIQYQHSYGRSWLDWYQVEEVGTK